MPDPAGLVSGWCRHVAQQSRFLLVIELRVEALKGRLDPRERVARRIYRLLHSLQLSGRLRRNALWARSRQGISRLLRRYAQLFKRGRLILVGRNHLSDGAERPICQFKALLHTASDHPVNDSGNPAATTQASRRGEVATLAPLVVHCGVCGGLGSSGRWLGPLP
jgi:hypothetical protein